MAAYRLVTGFSGVQREADGAFIPQALGNSDWLSYQAWVAGGNTPDAAPSPTPDDLLGQKMSAGIQIVSTGTPALSATYAIDGQAQDALTGQLAAIAAGLTLPLGAPTVPWADITGTAHNFTADQLKSLGQAVLNYRFSLQVTWNLLTAGQQADWPGQPVTIP